MSVLKEFLSVPELEARFNYADRHNYDLRTLFGAPPYYFLNGEAPPYGKFRVDYRDELGRQYQLLEPGVYGCRISIALRKKHPAMNFPASGEQLVLTGRGETHRVRVLGSGVAEGRRATALVNTQSM